MTSSTATETVAKTLRTVVPQDVVNSEQFSDSIEFSRLPGPPVFANKYEERAYLKGRLALAFRLFSKFGFEESVAGHITLRDPVEPDHFWVNPFGLAFSMLKSSDLIFVNPQGKVIDGGPNRHLNQAAFMIHHAIHTARPDVNCAAHSHSLYGRAFCTFGRELDILTQDSCAFYKDHAVYRQFKGIVMSEEEGLNVASALGSGKACLLQNHGLLTCGESIEAAVYWFTSLEKCCRIQLLTDAAASGQGVAPIKIDNEDAVYTYPSVGTPRAGWFAAQPMFAQMAKEAGPEYLE